jgi:hypothetical protein
LFGGGGGGGTGESHHQGLIAIDPCPDLKISSGNKTFFKVTPFAFIPMTAIKLKWKKMLTKSEYNPELGALTNGLLRAHS